MKSEWRIIPLVSEYLMHTMKVLYLPAIVYNLVGE